MPICGPNKHSFCMWIVAALSWIRACKKYLSADDSSRQRVNQALLFSGENKPSLYSGASATFHRCVCEERRHQRDYSTRFVHDRLSLLCSQIRSMPTFGPNKHSFCMWIVADLSVMSIPVCTDNKINCFHSLLRSKG